MCYSWIKMYPEGFQEVVSHQVEYNHFIYDGEDWNVVELNYYDKEPSPQHKSLAETNFSQSIGIFKANLIKTLLVLVWWEVTCSLICSFIQKTCKRLEKDSIFWVKVSQFMLQKNIFYS